MCHLFSFFLFFSSPLFVLSSSFVIDRHYDRHHDRHHRILSMYHRCHHQSPASSSSYYMYVSPRCHHQSPALSFSPPPPLSVFSVCVCVIVASILDVTLSSRVVGMIERHSNRGWSHKSFFFFLQYAEQITLRKTTSRRKEPAMISYI